MKENMDVPPPLSVGVGVVNYVVVPTTISQTCTSKVYPRKAIWWSKAICRARVYAELNHRPSKTCAQPGHWPSHACVCRAKNCQVRHVYAKLGMCMSCQDLSSQACLCRARHVYARPFG
ncbi:hypothetical protein ACFE04_026825 [Oxalis oulophora]